MDYKINGFVDLLISEDNINKLKNNKSIITLKKNIVYLEMKNNSKIANVFIFYLFEDKLYTRNTEIIFDKKYTLDEIKEHKTKILNYILKHDNNINLELNSTSNNVFDLFLYK